jgi:hypothetical protein
MQDIVDEAVLMARKTAFDEADRIWMAQRERGIAA